MVKATEPLSRVLLRKGVGVGDEQLKPEVGLMDPGVDLLVATSKREITVHSLPKTDPLGPLFRWLVLGVIVVLRA